MTHLQLKALRQLLFFTVDEAAVMVAMSPERPNGVSGRTWRNWENGRCPVPPDVAAAIQHLAQWRSEHIAYLQDYPHDPLIWYESAEQWGMHSLMAPLWRPHQSAVAHIVATVPGVVVVPYSS